jgi:hypothetical protein
MRSIKELLIILKKNKDSFETGLCMLIDDLKFAGIITPAEQNRLNNYIDKNHPKNYDYYPYYWEKYKWRPRIIWINKQIKKLTK